MTHFFVALQKIILNVINIRLVLFSLCASNCVHVSRSYRQGFSLIEVIIVIALLAVVASFSSLFSMNSISRSYALSERDLLVSLLTQTRVQAQSNINEQPHSLHIETDQYVMYEGTTYNPSNPTNRIIPKISKASVHGLDTITFEELTANVPTPGSLHIINDMETYAIEVNEVGRINW